MLYTQLDNCTISIYMLKGTAHRLCVWENMQPHTYQGPMRLAVPHVCTPFELAEGADKGAQVGLEVTFTSFSETSNFY